jgi:hypothetical protein
MKFERPRKCTAGNNKQENAANKVGKVFHCAPIRHCKLRLQWPSALPEVEKVNALMTSVTTFGKCTTDAKSMHTESITYEIKFGLLCKALQDNVPNS